MNKYSNVLNIYGDNRFAMATKRRISCRALIFQGDNILLTYETKFDRYYIPGGIIENIETGEECITRKVEEQTGYIINPVMKVLQINEYYKEWEYITHYYIVEIESEYGYKNLTEQEEKAGLETVWVPFKDAIKIFSHHNEFRYQDEERRGRYEREYKALMYYKNKK